MNFRVIIIEDEVLIAEDLRRMVETAHCRVVNVFLSAHIVRELMQHLDADLAFIDINLNGELDGFALAEELIARFRMPVIFVTGYSDISIIRRAATFVPYGYLLKPFSEDTVRISLEIAKARIEVERKNIISEKRYRDLFETMPAAFASHLLLYDDNGAIRGYRIEECNNIMRMLFNETGIGEVGYLEALFSESGVRWLELMHRVSSTASVETLEVFSPLLARWYNVIVYGPLPFECGLLMMNITERKQMEEKLTRLNTEIGNLAVYQQNILETERSIIAGNIHDYLGQYLTAILMDLSYIERNYDTFAKEQMAEFVNKTKSLLIEAIKSVRNLCTDLRADVLENLGLSSAIEWYVNERLNSAPFEVVRDLKLSDTTIDLKLAIHCFRVFQEAITNILRHANAEHVYIGLEAKDGKLVLEVMDDGVGIPPQAFERLDAHGLVGMRERARECGGTIEFISREPRGTIVRVMMPIYR